MIAHVFISGFVQGVGFRQFIKQNTLKLGLTGFVKNLSVSPQGGPDNRVEAVFQSSASEEKEAKEQINKIISICRKGPFLAEVKSVDVIWEANHQDISYKTFEIV